ncbi:MAG: ATP-binding protein [Caldilineaceae bacterium]
MTIDEFPEFGSHNLETLRQPLKDRIVITVIHYTVN